MADGVLALTSINRKRVARGISAGAPRERACVLRLAREHGGKSLLEVGAGAGFYASALGRPDLISCVRGADSRLESGARYDLIVISSLLEFLQDPESLFLDLCARVSPGGRLIVAVPRPGLIGSIYRLGRRATLGLHMKLFRASWLEELANDSGLSLEATRYPIPHRMVMSFERWVLDDTPRPLANDLRLGLR